MPSRHKLNLSTFDRYLLRRSRIPELAKGGYQEVFIMAHDYHHHEDDTYFIDQLCMVGLSGAFGVICVCLYFFQRSMLNLLLGPQFHLFVAISGFALLALALVRAATLWRESQPTTAIASLPVVHSHSHDHHHHHHDHAHDH